ncbi:hypothetical protein OH76DRAFT_1102541 [Lentinus brumalis]|uniref:F-box domain-containing protein n=1 Tax=Lentinus brumalis TaxID=2498619 RepID=A0A371CVL7_9APHY|nr:hypothetical protein OH76DRAFT_1102541 [Polyporus brumalis]
MSFLTLPPELTDYIISFLRNDRRTLCACTRVCKGWLPASRAYLFDTIRFKTPRSYTVFVEEVLGSRSMLPYLVLIHGIAIVSPDGFLNRYLADKFMRDMHGNLPNLRILRISYVDWRHLTMSDTWKYLDVNMTSPFPRLTNIAAKFDKPLPSQPLLPLPGDARSPRKRSCATTPLDNIGDAVDRRGGRFCHTVPVLVRGTIP